MYLSQSHLAFHYHPHTQCHDNHSFHSYDLHIVLTLRNIFAYDWGGQYLFYNHTEFDIDQLDV